MAHNHGEWATNEGLSARALIDPVWIAGPSSPVMLSLEIRNDGPKAVLVPLLDTISIQWRGPGGAWNDCDAGRNGTRPGPVSVQLGPAQTTRVERSATVSAAADGTLEVLGDDGFGGVWAIRRVAPGGMDVRLRLRSQNPSSPGGNSGQAGPPIWRGDVTTEDVQVQLRGSSSGA
jgi:hypothetical protein